MNNFRKDGFIILPQVFTADEVSAMDHECQRLLNLDLVDPDNLRTPYRFGASTFPERIDPVCDISPLFSQLIADDRLLQPVSECLGDTAILFKDKLILKGPGIDGYQMHQDWAWGWQDLCAADDVLSISIQIDGADPDNGGIELFPGYHESLLTPPGMATNFRDEELAQIKSEDGIKVHTQPGDVLIFHSLTPHQSGKNTTDRWRRSLYLSMNAQRAGNLRDQYYQNYQNNNPNHKWFQ